MISSQCFDLDSFHSSPEMLKRDDLFRFDLDGWPTRPFTIGDAVYDKVILRRIFLSHVESSAEH
jgi:hypothetical protein